MIIIISIIGGLLGVLGGTVNKDYRRLVLPIFLAITTIFALKSFIGGLLLALIYPLRLGYGLPEINDSGSNLRYFYLF